MGLFKKNTRVPVKKKSKPEKTEIEKLQEQTRELIDHTIEWYLKACSQGRKITANRLHRNIKYFHDVERLLPKMSSEAQKLTLNGATRYKVSSMLLSHIYAYLMDSGANEKMCYCTGVIDNETSLCVPIDILTPKMSIQSPVFVKGDQRSINDLLGSLDEYRHTILLQCHKHPGSGAGAVHPSGTDIKNHRDLEKCYPTIGAIFVRDGHFRFFSVGKKFEIEIYGSGVTRIDRQTYRLQV